MTKCPFVFLCVDILPHYLLNSFFPPPCPSCLLVKLLHCMWHTNMNNSSNIGNINSHSKSHSYNKVPYLSLSLNHLLNKPFFFMMWVLGMILGKKLGFRNMFCPSRLEVLLKKSSFLTFAGHFEYKLATYLILLVFCMKTRLK